MYLSSEYKSDGQFVCALYIVGMTSTTSTDDEELNELKKRLAPIVCGSDVVTLHEGYVPQGPETISDTERTPVVETKPPIEVVTNRYSGVIYASRFLVTRVGFLRSVKRYVVVDLFMSRKLMVFVE